MVPYLLYAFCWGRGLRVGQDYSLGLRVWSCGVWGLECFGFGAWGLGAHATVPCKPDFLAKAAKVEGARHVISVYDTPFNPKPKARKLCQSRLRSSLRVTSCGVGW